MTKLEKVKQKIRQLYKIASDPNVSDAEVISALAFIQKLCMKYDISQSDIEWEKDKKVVLKVNEEWLDIPNAKYDKTFGASIANTIAQFHNASIVTCDEGVRLFGTAENRALVKLILEVSMIRFKYSVERSYDNSSKTTPRRKFFKSYYLGANNGLYAKYKESQNSCKEEDIAKYSLLVTKHQEAIVEYMDEIGLQLRRRKSRSRTVCTDAYKDGYKDGKASDLIDF